MCFRVLFDLVHVFRARFSCFIFLRTISRGLCTSFLVKQVYTVRLFQHDILKCYCGIFKTTLCFFARLVCLVLHRSIVLSFWLFYCGFLCLYLIAFHLVFANLMFTFLLINFYRVSTLTAIRKCLS